MRYEGRVFRPPSEAYSLIVQATIGCSHNKCTFCEMYRDKQFRVRNLEETKEDFRIARATYRHVERIFLADGDALIMRYEQLEELLTYIRELFPECSRVGIYGSPRSIERKTPEELKALKALGLGIIYIGLETGSDIVLKKVEKGSTADELIAVGLKVKEAGILTSMSAISGLGGKEDMEDHAKGTARVFSAVKPHYAAMLTLLVEEGTPFYDEVEAGRVTLLSPMEVVEETKILLEHMDSEGTVFRSNHASNYINLSGTLNRDKGAMLALLGDALEGQVRFKKEQFRGF